MHLKLPPSHASRLARWAVVALCCVGMRCPAAAEEAPAPDAPAASGRPRTEEEHAKAQAAFQGRIDAAIERGAAWLASKQAADGTWGPYQTEAHAFGLLGLCLQTLATCGHGARHPAIVAGQRVLDRELAGPLHVMEWYGGHGSIITYSAATVLLFYEALHGDPRPTASAPLRPLPARVRRHIEALTAWLLRSRNASGWRYPYTNTEGRTDLSNMVYALMGLHAAARLGQEIGDNAWLRAARQVLALQSPDGALVPRWLPNVGHVPWVASSDPYVAAGEDPSRGWAYTPGSARWTGSMTSAGVASLAIAREHLLRARALPPEERAQLEQAMLAGIAWLGHGFDVQRNPGPDDLCWHVYHLYGLERAGALAGVDNFGRHDWYPEGAAALLAMQQPDGSWPGAARGVRWADFQPAVVQTCFALLFLKRGTRVPSTPLGRTLTRR